MSDSLLLTATRFTVLDTNGNPVSGAKIHTYIAGTSTPLTTYSDAALSVANANPVVCDSAGRAVIYLQNQAYKVIVADASDVTLYTQDNVNGAAPAVRTVCQGRITLTTGVPITTSDVINTGTVYFAPYLGNCVSLYNGSAWLTYAFSEVSLALGSDTTGLNYDLFLQNVAGTLTLKRVAWTNDTTRASALALQDGIYVLGSDATQRYLGTYRTTGIGQTTDSAAKRLVWNYYNRVRRSLLVIDSTDSWSYTTATMRQANGSSANQVAVVVGIAETTVDCEVIATAANTNVGVGLIVAIGKDATNAAAAGVLMNAVDSPTANQRFSLRSRLVDTPAIGYHFYAWLEYSNAVGTTTWFGDGGSPTQLQSGLVGHMFG